MAPIIYSPAATPVEEKTENAASCRHKQNPVLPPPEHNYIQTSPYTEQEHLLDLNALTKPHRIMAQALTGMQPLSGQYATMAYKEAFNWEDVVDKVRELSEAEGAGYVFPEMSFYVIVFRSKVPPGVYRPELGDLDKEAHREAVESGWLLKYWFGTADQEGKNLATLVLAQFVVFDGGFLADFVLWVYSCLWRHIDDAKLGGSGPVRHNMSDWLKYRGMLIVRQSRAMLKPCKGLVDFIWSGRLKGSSS